MNQTQLVSGKVQSDQPNQCMLLRQLCNNRMRHNLEVEIAATAVVVLIAVGYNVQPKIIL